MTYNTTKMSVFYEANQYTKINRASEKWEQKCHQTAPNTQTLLEVIIDVLLELEVHLTNKISELKSVQN